MNSVKIIKILLLIVWPGCIGLYAQETISAGKVLDKYIKFGLGNNLSLQAKQFNLQKSHLALQEAKSYYLPTVTFQSDYSLAAGGRKIDLPLGDLLNNVYTSLNQLTASNEFKMVQNQRIALMQPVLQNTRIQTLVPLVNQEIRYFNQIQKEVITEKQAEVNVYKRELIRDIRVAYYSYLQTLKLIAIYKNANLLLLDNIRYTEVLIKNSKGLKSNLLKVEAQLSKNAALLSEAENKSKAAAAYFNFLINSPLETPVIPDSTIYNLNNFSTVNPSSGTISGREEIGILQSLIKQSALAVKKEKAAWFPQVGAYMNAGIQGNNFNLNKESGYILGGIQFTWTIYSGSKISSKAKQAGKDVQILQLKLNEAVQQIEVENIRRKLELNSALAKLAASKSNQQYALEIYRETQLRYRQNQALSIELLDAFTQLINSQLEFELIQTDILIKQAEIERTTASYIL